jgi:S-DNA-T family DNA segregation ATPase FtsK/SpoIIIE
VVLLIDGWPALEAELDRPGGLALAADLSRVVVDGPGVGVRCVIAADRPGALRPSLGAAMTQRLVLRLADAVEQRALGLPAAGLSLPGRGVVLPSGLTVQVAQPGAGGELRAAVAAAAGRWSPGSAAGGPVPLGRLPDDVAVDELVDAADLAADPWFLPVGIGSDELAVSGWQVHPGEHILVVGPPRSGRTTVLAALGRVVRRHRPDVAVIAVVGRRLGGGDLPVDACVAADRLEELDRWVGARRLVVLVDDAEQVDDQLGTLAALAESHRPDVMLIAAARNDAVRNQYGSWVRQLRTSRLGLLLQPDVEADGDLFGVRLPRRAPVTFRAGRGYLLNGGNLEVVQAAGGRSEASAAAA